MKQILITGGAELMGSHLSERLLNEGSHPHCVNNFYTGTKKNMVHLIGNQYFELIRHDVTLPPKVETDEIYNLAFPASTVHYQCDAV